VTRIAHQPVRVFVSYSHKDLRHFDRLRASLRRLSRQRVIEEWHDRKIVPGQEWVEAIDEDWTKFTTSRCQGRKQTKDSQLATMKASPRRPIHERHPLRVLQ
jgi:hypothetical protein